MPMIALPRLGDASIVPVDTAPVVLEANAQKVGDLAMLLSIVSSLVLILRR